MMLISAHYIVIQSLNGEDLCKQVQAKVMEGYDLVGGVHVAVKGEHLGFFQALIRKDERLKEDMEPIGKTFDGQPIYRYK